VNEPQVKGSRTVKTAVVYYSETGNTARVGEAIAQALDPVASSDNTARAATATAATQRVIVAPIQDEPTLDGCDLVFVGMPVIRFGAPEPAQVFLEEQCAGHRVALFVTHTAPDYLDLLEGWLNACKVAATAATAELVGFFHCQGALAEPVRQYMLASGDAMLMQFGEMASCADGQPDDAALARAAEFARETVARVELELAGEPAVATA